MRFVLDITEPPTYQNPNTRQWIQGSVTFDVGTSGTIMFDGVRGNGYYGDIAIDDISIKQCVSEISFILL